MAIFNQLYDKATKFGNDRSGSFNKSVFSANSYKAAIGDDKGNGYAVVKITPKYPRLMKKNNDPSIKGVLDTSDGGFSFNIPSNWGSFGDAAGAVLPGLSNYVEGKYRKVNNIFNAVGAADIGAAYASRKIYQKSSFMEIKIPLMVVDWNGIGQPILSAMLLSYYCLPDKIGDGKDLLDYGNRKLEEALKAGQESDNQLARIGSNTVHAVKNFTEGVVNMAENAFDEIKDEVMPEGSRSKEFLKQEAADLEDATALRASPVPVKIEIGQFFKHDDMIIENLQYTFSKEMTKAGPLYVKFELSLSTRKILTGVEDIGLSWKGNTSRFFKTTKETTNGVTTINRTGNLS